MRASDFFSPPASVAEHDTDWQVTKRRRPRIRPMRFLTVVFSESAGVVVRAWLLDKRLVVGRAAGTGVVALADPALSRPHFAINHHGPSDRYVIEDLGSASGTFVDGARVTRQTLDSGQVVSAGTSHFVFTEVTTESALPPITAGLSPVRAVDEQALKQVAPADLTVLLQGPTGSGKERAARLLHDHSGRSGEFVVVNASLLKDGTAAGDLFGHVRGGYTGAVGDRPGAFRRADGGTLFIDEVAELDLRVQADLLRATQEGEVKPVGSDRIHQVDVRLVCASHADLAARVVRGTFREDLYARIANVVAQVHPLRDRREEILPHFAHYSGNIPLTVEAAQHLLLHPWRRNVRELVSVAKRIKAAAPSIVEPESLHLPAPAAAPSDLSMQSLTALLEAHQGNVTAVANAAGCTRKVVYSRCRQFGLDAETFRKA